METYVKGTVKLHWEFQNKCLIILVSFHGLTPPPNKMIILVEVTGFTRTEPLAKKPIVEN